MNLANIKTEVDVRELRHSKISCLAAAANCFVNIYCLELNKCLEKTSISSFVIVVQKNFFLPSSLLSLVNFASHPTTYVATSSPVCIISPA